MKYEDVYLRDYQTPAEARLGLERYFGYYNHHRRHQALGRRTPGEVYGAAGPDREKRIVSEVKSGIITADGGWSAAAVAAVAPVALRAPSATAAQASPMVTVPPYFSPEPVQRMGTS